jgi:hypothetical protein
MNSAQAFARKKLNLNDLHCASCEAWFNVKTEINKNPDK